jgi:hypothetical protein
MDVWMCGCVDGWMYGPCFYWSFIHLMREEVSSRDPLRKVKFVVWKVWTSVGRLLKNHIIPWYSLGIRVVLRIDNFYSQKILNTWFWIYIYIYITMDLNFFGEKNSKNHHENRRFFHGTQRVSVKWDFLFQWMGILFGGSRGTWYLLHMTKFYSKKGKDFMALIRQILNFKK